MLLAPRLLQAFGVASTSPMASHALSRVSRSARCATQQCGGWRWRGAWAPGAVVGPGLTTLDRFGSHNHSAWFGCGRCGRLLRHLLASPLPRPRPENGSQLRRQFAEMRAAVVDEAARELRESWHSSTSRDAGKISAYPSAREAAKLSAVSSAAHAVVSLGWRRRSSARPGLRRRRYWRASSRRKKHKFRRSHRILRLGLATGLGCSSLLATGRISTAQRRRGPGADPSQAAVGSFSFSNALPGPQGLTPVRGLLMGRSTGASMQCGASNIAFGGWRGLPSSLDKLWRGTAALFVVQCGAGLPSRVADGP